ncbi:membrane-bound glycerophospholipid O-acyltransferase 1 isoform X2 [Microcaecilia unicolor]|uniref:Lysophospholipid acyltransferase 1 isoform X2 n=1 Tax=Microcaecilia unicolor TaxID=1415580 RepID=A0A6P7YRQ5_9AMPH|nr:lysophospholipid acyltransferase 1 isoform X2 [Microcaecilia unicolor]
MARDHLPPRSTGSALLQPISDHLQIPLEQVNFVACQLFALVAAVWFRIFMSPSKTTPDVRHACVTLFGVYFVVFCFGWYSFLAAMGYLTVCQISRVYIFSYGILTTDFSGPLMIITQKITSLAFQVHDGIGRRAEDLTPEQLRLAVRTRPSFLEYLSYHLNFMSVLAGPCSNYKDYIAFIEGRHVHMKLLDVNWKQKGHDKLPDPSPNRAVVHKLCIVLVSLVLFLKLTKMFPYMYIVDDSFIAEASFLSRLGYLYIITQVWRPKYYFAWTLADAVNNAAGYGFSGIDERGNSRWDLISNLNIWNIETATSFKMYIDNWNIQTATWLKRICYDRVPWYPTVMTFLLSALWHGVYPGYYFTFITAIPATLAARAVRNNFRHYFLSSRTRKLLYDILTWVTTQLAICYTVAPFSLLAVEPTIKFYRSMYFYLHIICIFVLLLLPIKPQRCIPKHAQNATTKNCFNNEKIK